MTPFDVGKLPAETLRRMIEHASRPDARVLVGPGVGEDAAVIDMGDRCLVAKTDPITFATDHIGWYAVQVNANDVACCGATPRWFLATVLLPEGTADESLVTDVFGQLRAACDGLDITLCGGHTEITYGLDRPVVVGCMLGEAARDEVVTTAGARPGDALLVTKGIAVEGTALLAREKAEELAPALGRPLLERAGDLLTDPGISVVRDARVALASGAVHALHDPTEGGIATGLAELAVAADVGLEVERAALPVLAECAAICQQLGLDPLGLIASGSLLAAVAPEDADAIAEALGREGIAASRIGRVTDGGEGTWIAEPDGTRSPLPHFDRDEIARVFAPDR